MDKTRTAFTLSLHFYPNLPSENHLDLFLDIDQKNALIHYRAWLRKLKPGIEDRKSSKPKKKKNIPMELGNPHRRIYLNFQGRISKGRGKLRILKKGRLSISGSYDPQKPRKYVKLIYDTQGRDFHSFVLRA